jgi:hypothetical protein
MTNQSKRRSRISAYVRSTALSALGPASLTTVPTPARAQQAPCGDPRVCSCAPGITSSAGGAPRLSQPEPTAPTFLAEPHAEVPRLRHCCQTPRSRARPRTGYSKAVEDRADDKGGSLRIIATAIRSSRRQHSERNHEAGIHCYGTDHPSRYFRGPGIRNPCELSTRMSGTGPGSLCR